MKRVFSILFVVTLFLSCSSNDDSQSSDIQEENFYALTVGNSWVYKNYKYSSISETYEDTGVIDSISIIETEELNTNTYFKFRRLTTGNENNITFCNANGEHFELLRDSSGYLINDLGKIKFINSNFEERILSENFLGTILEKLVEGSQEISVEAGTFNCINSERYAKDDQGEQLPGLDRFYYSDGFGLIYDTSSFVSQDTPSIIRRLDSYNVQ